jgi:hypothetical protein
VKTAGGIVLYESRDGQLIRLYDFMPRANLPSGTSRRFLFGGRKGRRQRRHSDRIVPQHVMRDF